MPDEFDGRNPEHVNSIVEDLENVVAERRRDMDLQRDKAMDLVRHECRLLMIKMSKQVKTATVAEFREKFGTDLRDFVLTTTTITNTTGAMRNSNTKRQRVTADDYLRTPVRPARSVLGAAPTTVQRTVRRGERIFSGNGSPLAEQEGVSIKAVVGKRGRNDGNGTHQTDLGLHLGNGEYMNMVPETIAGMDTELKSLAWKQLKALQKSLSTIEECFSQNDDG